ncbi:MAG: polysaccharide deacetylase family protein [Muribaculaceae bacterium]|nr:polysaccharide deacetylase family protein [Muribaculaceae bacterium]
MLIERPPFWYRLMFPGAIFRMPQSQGKPGTIYLTFDDGPIPEMTPWVLDILDQYGVKATFFMVGQNVERNPELFEEVKRRGHRVGNHTLHHIKGMGINPVDYLKDVNKCQRYTRSELFRPPHGYLTPSQLREMKKYFKVVMFDLVTRDYSKHVTSEQVVENVKKYARDGSIIVFHDSLKSKEKLKKALPMALEWLKDQGYQFGLL